MDPVFHTVLALGVVGLLLFSMISTMKDKTDFDKQFLSTDLSLIIDTIQSMPGTVFLKYAQDTKNFSFQFNDNVVNVYEKDKLPLSSYFIDDKNSPLLLKTLGEFPVSIAFLKQGNKFEVDYKDNIEFNENIVVCPSLKPTKSLESTSFLLVSDESLREITDSLEAQHPNHDSFYISADTFDEIRNNIDIVIELKTSQNDDELKIFYHTLSKSSKTLSCSISNLFATNIKSVNTIPIDKSYFQFKGKEASLSIILPRNYPKNVVNIINKGLIEYFENE
ncbi:hypothetical protein CEE44_02465 [Candidatus Woesearchaeota archaeon B3_Woes]|nr:MAG: hypothetical protein CEE44_02465 [Candidatus Woesearchaeota archaeon B3_Woes]